MKPVSCDTELNSESNGVVFMGGTYLVKTALANILFLCASFTVMGSSGKEGEQ